MATSMLIKKTSIKRCCKRYSFTVPFPDGVDTPIILPQAKVREFAVDDHDPDVLEDESPDTDGMTAYESSSDDDADAHTMTPEDMQESRVFGISTTFSGDTVYTPQRR
jgi:hypothetical protein